MPQPVLSLAYLVALRLGWVAPSFVPLVVLAAFPVASALLGRSGRTPPPRLGLGLPGVAALELLWTALAQAMVGFAFAWRSG